MAKLPVVDEYERDSIRDALKRYMADHQAIGAPELHQRMMYVLGKLDSQLSRPTLQRFLKGSRRTEDRIVRLYRQFLEMASPAPAYEKLGEAIATFYTSERFARPRAEVHEDVTNAFAGSYRGYLQGERTYPEGDGSIDYPGFPIFESPPQRLGGKFPPYQIPYSSLKLTVIAGTPFLAAFEWVYNIWHQPEVTQHLIDCREISKSAFEGVLAIADRAPFGTIVLRELMTLPYQPKTYFLTRLDPDAGVASPLLATGMTFALDTPIDRSPFEARHVMFFPVNE